MSPPIGLSRRDGVGWGGGGGARTIIEGVASTGWVSDARVETTTHFYTSRVWEQWDKCDIGGDTGGGGV